MQGEGEMGQGGDGGMQTCPTCGQSFESQEALTAHQNEAHEAGTMPEPDQTGE